MQDEFTNRLSMFHTVLGVLNDPARKTVWHNQPPTIFTAKVTAAEQAVSDLDAFVQQHGAEPTGAAVDKAREEKELEDAAFSFGQALVCWFRDQADEANAALFERPISAWRRLRDQELLAQARIVRDAGQALVSGPDSAAAAGYDITSATVQALADELADYEAVITTPQQTIAGRKALTTQFRARFNEVEEKFVALDKLILRFDKSSAGRNLIAAFQASRIIRDLGHGPGTGGNNGGGDSGGGGDNGGGGDPGTTIPAAPAQPTLTNAAAGQIIVTWSLVSGAMYYNVYHRNVATQPNFVLDGPAASPPAILTEMPPGATIRVRLTAATPHGESEPSPEAEITVPQVPPMP